MYVNIVDNLLATPYQNLGEHRSTNKLDSAQRSMSWNEDSWCERNSPSLSITLQIEKILTCGL